MMQPLPPDNTTTASEAYLAKLCRRAFLSLWSYPGLYRDQGLKRSGHGKELCDLLVVFGDDLLIFSDKDCELRLDPTPDVGWARWYKKAVLDAAKQIVGAERWLLNNPGRVFIDRACKRRIPLKLPARPRVHRIVTCRGAAPASTSAFGGTGSLIVTNAPLDSCSNQPLHLGAIDGDGALVHVMDEVAMDVVLTTFDTAPDLCRYLSDREDFFRRYEMVVAAGEDDLVAHYMENYDKSRGHYFGQAESGADEEGHGPTMLTIDEGFWEGWESSERRAAKARADEISYAWDRLVDKFAFHMLTETQDFTTPGGVAENEVALRWMAKEPRVRRRMLARALLEAMETTAPGQMRRRLVLPSRPGDPHWVFCVLPRPPSVSPERYREARRQLLVDLCRVAKHVNPEALDIAGIAVGPDVAELSEDLVHLDARSWTTELAADAAALHARTGYFATQATPGPIEYEFPVAG